MSQSSSFHFAYMFEVDVLRLTYSPLVKWMSRIFSLRPKMGVQKVDKPKWCFMTHQFDTPTASISKLFGKAGARRAARTNFPQNFLTDIYFAANNELA